MTSTSSQETERQREITRLCVQVAQLLYNMVQKVPSLCKWHIA
ncbi:hypothetical protein EPMMONJG_02508 [Mannheimia haemolytica]|nr:hypothetical protein F382_12645 [Mannheimia haemolytica D153]AGQ42288.1 hypothetical protein J451_12720 [Mannheimia haemolytica D174]AGR74702.1 hypothetical protein N220_04810 [Mannheimia haemolytica USMARC_2286]EPZ27508.1 hypothetical protein L280_13390 [Mannheimia haemolytica MhBrain2012]SQE31369.1 Uncharacterised protein [Mannheimia haemolytica]